MRFGVNLPGPFWISSRIKGCGCLTLMLLPILILFFLAQRYFVQGIVMTGIKG